MKKFLCNQHWRVLVIEGKPCNFVIVDIYKRGLELVKETLVRGPPDLGGGKLGDAEVQVVGEEAIYLKFCTEEPGNPEEYFKKAWELVGAAPKEVKCEEETP